MLLGMLEGAVPETVWDTLAVVDEVAADALDAPDVAQPVMVATKAAATIADAMLNECVRFMFVPFC